MRICPSLVLILSLAACEHASNATQPSTLPAEVGVVAPKPGPAARTVAPAMRPKLLPDCEHYRATRAAPKWNAECERPRVTKKPATAGDPASAAKPEASKP